MALVNISVGQGQTEPLDEPRRSTLNQRTHDRMPGWVIGAHEFGERRTPHIANTHSLAHVHIPVCVHMDPLRIGQFFMRACGQLSPGTQRETFRKLFRGAALEENSATGYGLALMATRLRHWYDCRPVYADSRAREAEFSGRAVGNGSETLGTFGAVKFIVTHAEVGNA